MKITKKITSIVLALLLAVSAFAGLAITANAADLPDSVTLTIHKYAIDENDNKNAYIGNNTSNTTGDTTTNVTGTPLDGVVFSYVRVCGLNEAADQHITVSGVNAAREYFATTYNSAVTANFKDLPATTNGTTTLTLSDPSKYGLYLVVEKSSPASVTEKSVPFFVYLPTTDSNGESFKSTVDVYPKNLTTLGGAVLTKTINNTAFNAISNEDYAKLTTKPQFTLYKRVKTADATTDTEIAGPITADKNYTTPVAITDNGGVDYSSTAKIAQKNGVIAVDGLPVGTYVFKETTQAEYNGETLPLAPEFEFTVTKGQNGDVTLTDTGFAETSGIVTTETRDNSSTPTVTKTVGTSNATVLIGETTSKTFQFGETVPYTITTSAPADINDYKTYTITDKLDTQLQFTAGTVVVKNGETPLTAGTDYDLTEPAEGNAYTLTVDLTETGIGKLAANSSVTVDFEATIKDTAEVNTAIPNTAKISWTNANDSTGVPESTPVYVATLGFDAVKVDSADQKVALEGAEFELYDGNNRVYVVETAETGVYKVTTTTNTTKIVTPRSGIIKIEGLASKTYNLKETKAPYGYQLPTTNFTVAPSLTTNIGAAVATDDTAAVRALPNVKQPDLPLTGGMGTILFTVAGLALIGGSAFFFIRSRKTRKEEI